MAACRLGRSAWKAGLGSLRQASTSSSQASQGLKLGEKVYGSLGGAGLFAGLFIGGQVFADSFEIHPTHLPWVHLRYFKSMDHAAIRRGFQVYQQVCSACHGFDFLYWRQLVNVAYTEKEVKAMAAETLVEDGPDDTGAMFMRPGKPSDLLPKPYKNDKEARFANNSAYPPPLDQIVRARHGGIDYIFSLLTGYFDPPEGVDLAEGMHYNAYFHGHQIGMAKALYAGVMEYEEGDDTPATTSQMAKDVSIFLHWTAQKNYDKRALWSVYFGIPMALMFVGAYITQKRYYAKEFYTKVLYTKLPRRK